MDDQQFHALLAAKDAQIAALMAQVAGLVTSQAQLTDAIARLSLLPAAVPSSLLTVQAVYDAFEEAHRGAHSWRVMRNRLKAFVAAFGALPAMNLTPAMWKAHREKRKLTTVKRGEREDPLSPLTINFELGWAKKMFTWASDPEQGLIPSNPLARVKAEPVDSARETWLTMVEVEKLLAHWDDNPVMTLFLLIAISTGLRISEILRIRRDRIKRHIEGGEIVGTIELAKRKNKTRKTYYASIPPRAMTVIDAQDEAISGLLFPSPYRPGRPYGTRHISRQFREGCLATKIDYRAAEGDGHVRCHDVRHSAATLAAQEGATLPQVQQMLNHTTPVHTVRYMHYDEGAAVSFAMLMEGGLRKSPHRTTAALTRPAKIASAE